MAKALFDDGMSRTDAFWGDPDLFVLIEDPADEEWGHLYDPRVKEVPDPMLVASMLEDGWLSTSAVGVMKDPNTGRPVVVDGRRRVTAAREANKQIRAAYRGDPHIEAKLIRVKALPADRKALIEKQAAIMVASNMLRRDYTPLERAEILGRWLDRCGDKKAVARAAGLTVAGLEGILKLQQLAKPVRAAVEKGLIAASSALELSGLPAKEQATQLSELTQGGTKRARLGAVKKAAAEVAGKRVAPSAKALKADMANLEERLRRYQIARALVDEFTLDAKAKPEFLAGALWGIRHARGVSPARGE